MVTIDIKEQAIVDMSYDLLKVLLTDKTTGKYILWATDNYTQLGDSYFPNQEMTPELLIGKNTNIIQPRVLKSSAEQVKRTHDKAEVFTPSWICNKQNNLVDNAWFGRSDVFNQMNGTAWTVNRDKVQFPNGKKWQDYVDARRLEISCGEAPYLVSRYDAVTGKTIPITERIGLLDRKLRVVNENIDTEKNWVKWATRAYQSCYGYEYQGDNVLLARENLLLTFIDYYADRFGKKPTLMQIKKIATIISWNIWQMDGLKCVVPYSCHETIVQEHQLALFDEDKEEEEVVPCSGCEKNDIFRHNGIYCCIYDWTDLNKSIPFIDVFKQGNNYGEI